MSDEPDSEDRWPSCHRETIVTSVPVAMIQRMSTMGLGRFKIAPQRRMLTPVAMPPGSRARPVCMDVKPSTVCASSGNRYVPP